MKSPVKSPSVSEVLAQEFAQVAASRNLRLGDDRHRASPAKNSVGLAFSGGGIRSATFNLGILQALAKNNLLRTFDYLSTVSGGGYISGWLMAWMHHQDIGVCEIERRLATPPKAPQEAADQPEVHFLREYSNYLTPRKGLLGADFWAFVASYLRNTMLNQMILVLALLSLLLVPRTFVHVLHMLEVAEVQVQQRYPENVQQYLTSQNFALLLGVVFAGMAVIFIGLNFLTMEAAVTEVHEQESQRPEKKAPEKDAQKPCEKKADCWFAKQWAVQLCIIVPLFLAAALFTYGFGQFLTDWGILNHPWLLPPLLGGVIYLAQWTGAFIALTVVGYFLRKRIDISVADIPGEYLVLSTALVTGAIIGYLCLPFARLLIPQGAAPGVVYSKWHVMTFGVPAEVLIMLLAGVLHIGLMGRGFSDAHREWWGRLGGWMLLYAAGWFAFFLIAIYFPWGVGQLYCWGQNRIGHPITFGGVAVWIASTLYGVLFGKSKSTSEILPSDTWKKKLPAYAAKITPYIFILGSLLASSLLAAVLAAWATDNGRPVLAFPDDWSFSPLVPALCGVLMIAALLLSWRVDINQFSIHYLYRNRLIRCYLGASVADRHAQPFTGFSEADNLPLGKLRIPLESPDSKYGRPLPIFNTSLNVVRGKELALQTRKARSFAFTPGHSGFTRAVPGGRGWQSFYAPTSKGAAKMPGFPDGLTLGTAIAISGAAASPNMGFYSQPALGLLMTIFDVRLGWWLGNPGKDNWSCGSPRLGFYWLLRELFGATNDDSEFVYLSDGGHFENLGVYELVRRRCKLIVACDASCDPGYSFGDLHNAMERCRTDFGVDISFEVLAPLRPKPDSADSECKRSQAHYAVGKIHYNPESPLDDGTIIYIKPALVEGDPRDVLAYEQIDKAFPHDSTTNQWFDETHFESYRALGEAAGEAASVEIKKEIRPLLHLSGTDADH